MPEQDHINTGAEQSQLEQAAEAAVRGEERNDPQILAEALRVIKRHTQTAEIELKNLLLWQRVANDALTRLVAQHGQEMKKGE